MRVQKEHRIEVPAGRLFELIFDGDFEKRMNLEAMHSENYEVLDRHVDGDTWTMRSRITPKDDMPGFLKKLVGNAFSMEEQLSHKKGSDTATGTMLPSALREKVRMSYSVRVVPEGDNACRRIMDWDIEVKVFAVGGQIEKFVAGKIEQGMEASARYLNQHGKQVA